MIKLQINRKRRLNIKQYLDGRTYAAVGRIAFPNSKKPKQELYRHYTYWRKTDFPGWIDIVADYLGVDKEQLIEYEDDNYSIFVEKN